MDYTLITVKTLNLLRSMTLIFPHADRTKLEFFQIYKSLTFPKNLGSSPSQVQLCSWTEHFGRRVSLST